MDEKEKRAQIVRKYTTMLEDQLYDPDPRTDGYSKYEQLVEVQDVLRALIQEVTDPLIGELDAATEALQDLLLWREQIQENTNRTIADWSWEAAETLVKELTLPVTEEETDGTNA